MSLKAEETAHFCTDLNMSSNLIHPERCLMCAPLTQEIQTNIQSARLSILVTMLDVAGSDPVLAAWTPDWTATQDLSVNTIGKIVDGPIVVDARLLRKGKKIIFVSADFYDGHGISNLNDLQDNIDKTGDFSQKLTRAAKGIVTFTRIPRSAASGVDTYNPNNWLGVTKKRASSRYNANTLNKRIGLRVTDAKSGFVEISNTSYVANSIGTINGGVQAVVMEAAAEAMRPGMVVSDIQIHFLSQLKVGPASTVGNLIRETHDHSVVEIRLMDSGAGDKLIAAATLMLQKPHNLK